MKRMSIVLLALIMLASSCFAVIKITASSSHDLNHQLNQLASSSKNRVASFNIKQANFNCKNKSCDLTFNLKDTDSIEYIGSVNGKTAKFPGVDIKHFLTEIAPESSHALLIPLDASTTPINLNFNKLSLTKKGAVSVNLSAIDNGMKFKAFSNKPLRLIFF